MITRRITSELNRYAKLYPVVSVTGPRQSGKTTLVRMAFPNYEYFSLEDPDIRVYATNDPRKFLEASDKGMIIDEIQRVPELFSYIQGIVDKNADLGQYIITGSQNFLMLENISQSLAGRVAILKLLPFSVKELEEAGINGQNVDELIFQGAYPRIYDYNLHPTDFYPFYIQTYVERDVKLIRNISDQSTFITFLRMCAGRVGQLLSINDVASSCGISQVTAKSWLSILQASYIIYLLKPHHQNFNKRLVKMPKLYFYDTGLASSLLGLKNDSEVPTHFAYGQLFENFVINEFIKEWLNKGAQPDFYFWRDKNGHEVDLIIQISKKLIPIEIKAGKTFTNDFFKNLDYWNKISQNHSDKAWLIYQGKQSFETSKGHALGFHKIQDLLDILTK
ncbi:MAG: ATP-binding protein [Bacteroidales bacterium]|nr:ATP-binding protein [Bacteroidales bacterium]